jgi:WD40 repeat protein
MSGTGFVWPSPGKVVTAYHVVAAAKGGSIIVKFTSGDQVTATLKAALLAADLALLELSNAPPNLPVEVARNVSNNVRLFGYIANLPKVVDRPLYISSLGIQTPSDLPDDVRSSLEKLGFPYLDNPIYTVSGVFGPGDSGAPIVDSTNRVIAIGDGGLGNGVGWAIPTTQLDLLLSASLPPEISPETLENVSVLFSMSSMKPRSFNVGSRHKVAIVPFEVPIQLAGRVDATTLTALLGTAAKGHIFYEAVGVDAPAGAAAIHLSDQSVGVVLTPAISSVNGSWTVSGTVLDIASGHVDSFSFDGTPGKDDYPELIEKLWRAVDVPPVISILPHDEDIAKIRFSPDESIVATLTVDQSVHLWEFRSANMFATFSNRAGSDLYPFVRFAEGTKLVATTKLSNDGDELYDFATHKVFPLKFFDAETFVQISPSRKIILTAVNPAGSDKYLLLGDLYEDHSSERRMPIYSGPLVPSFAMSPDWDTYVTRPFATTTDTDMPGPKGEQYVVPGEVINLWHTNPNNLIGSFTGNDYRYITSDILAVNESSGVLIWNIRSKKVMAHLPGKLEQSSSSYVVTSSDRKLSAWETRTGKAVSSFEASDYINQTLFDEGSGTFVVNGPNSVELFDTRTGVRKMRVEINSPSSEFSIDGKYLSIPGNGHLKIINVKQAAIVLDVDLPVDPNSSLSPAFRGVGGINYDLAVVSFPNGQIQLWSLINREERVLDAERWWKTYAPGTIYSTPEPTSTSATLVHQSPLGFSLSGRYLAAVRDRRLIIFDLTK